MRKIQSFTLIDILIAMLISSIIIGMATLVFLGFQKHLIQKSKISKTGVELLKLEVLLSSDFQSSEIITGDESTLRLTKTKNGTVEYSFLETSIVRNSVLGTDTFKFPLENLVITYQNLEKRIANYFQADLVLPNSVITISKAKTYPKELLFNIEQSSYGY